LNASNVFCDNYFASELGLQATDICCVEFEMWGDGKQTRSFCYIDDCVEGIIRLMNSNIYEPTNIGSGEFSLKFQRLTLSSDEMISMNDMAKLIMEFEGKNLTLNHIPGPEGVRGRNSDNTFIKEKLGWAPSTPLKEGLRKLYFWMKDVIEAEKKQVCVLE
jgi:GDP-D-mannose 3',5'-epimerase